MKIGLFIGRFSPVHLGHINTINKMLLENDKVIIAIGSLSSAFSTKKILTANETMCIFRDIFPSSSLDINYGLNENITFIHLYDNLYNDLDWATNIRLNVQQVICHQYCHKEQYTVNLYGYNKDYTSKYLNWFPHYKLIEGKPFLVDGKIVNATDIREYLFNNLQADKQTVETYLNKLMPTVATSALINIVNTNFDRFIKLKEEYDTYKKYKDAWANAPYPPVFVTGDAVVFCNGHVLVIKRKFNPGKSLMALPGGFINQNETIKECILRELKEETKINVPPNKLSNSVRAIETFDAPNRSLRGRTITHAGVILLRDESCLPRVTAADDAISASWLPIEYLDTKRSEFFEDHYHIIKNLLKYYQEV